MYRYRRGGLRVRGFEGSWFAGLRVRGLIMGGGWRVEGGVLFAKMLG